MNSIKFVANNLGNADECSFRYIHRDKGQEMFDIILSRIAA